MNVTLCGGDDELSPHGCPSVRTEGDSVLIGEDENAVVLKPQEWNRLVDMVNDGTLKKV